MTEPFKLIYTETCTVWDKCYHVVDGVEVEANLMNTVLTPIHQREYNFEPLKEHNYYLREGHPLWDMLLHNFKHEVMNEWLKILVTEMMLGLNMMLLQTVRFLKDKP